MNDQRARLRATLASWGAMLADLPATPQELTIWLARDLRTLMGFEKVFCAHGELTAGEIRLTHWLAVGHDDTYLAQLSQTFEIESRGSLAKWLATREPILIDPPRAMAYASPFELQEIRDFGLRNIAAHGILNIRGNAGTYFSFSGFDEPLGEWHEDMLRCLLPTLCELFTRLCAMDEAPDASLVMTPRQAEIARLVVDGHDNKTIASRLQISEKTVRNQLSILFEATGVRRRTQLMGRMIR